jgi:hypothetical protein
LPARTPLNPQLTGTRARAGYRIEKVIYESTPRHHVTANLYVPAGAHALAGVLLRYDLPDLAAALGPKRLLLQAAGPKTGSAGPAGAVIDAGNVCITILPAGRA